ncbi:Sodium/calcium exchanger protein-domain-containing protein [Aspergillus varians]
MHRIRSWAKAHASTAADSQPQASSPESTDRPDDPDIQPQNDQVNKPAGDPASGSLKNADNSQQQGLVPRMKNGSIRFVRHTRTALCHSWVNVLLVFVPLGIAVQAIGLDPAVIFAMNAVAIIPLAGILSHATECVATRMGDAIGALLNVTFGNAVELIIFIIALVKNEIRIVQASLLGSILANLLLILGMAFLLGGLRFQEQIYNSTVTQMSACLLSLAVTSLLLPTAFHASFKDSDDANRSTLKVSRGTSVVLLLVYVLYIVFQLKSHSYLYASIPQQIIDEESHPGVLADFMNSSSDSSSSSSSDESDDTTTSWTTAKRIKRAMKYRKHRKPSISSRGTASPEMLQKSSTGDVSSLPPRRLSSTSASNPNPNPNSNLRHDTYIVDVDANADQDARNPSEPRSRDFGDDSLWNVNSVTGASQSDLPQSRDFGQAADSILTTETNSRRSKREWKKKRRVAKQETKKQPTIPGLPSQPAPNSRVSTLSIEQGETADLPRKWSPFRPNLPSLLSNTVFANPPPTLTSASRDPLGNFNGLRRTHSLPSLAQRPAPQRPPPVGNAVQFARAAARTPAAVNPAGTPQQPQQHPEPEMSRTAAVVMLLVSTGLVAVCAEFLVDAIPAMVESSSVSEAFIGLIILPIVGNAAEHVTAVTVATKNKMDLSIGVSVGSSIQIAIFVTPLVVVLGWCMDKDMSLYFTLFETISLFVTCFVVNFLVLDGRSNYLEGALLIAAYVIIAVAAFFYPDNNQASDLGQAG